MFSVAERVDMLREVTKKWIAGGDVFEGLRWITPGIAAPV